MRWRHSNLEVVEPGICGARLSLTLVFLIQGYGRASSGINEFLPRISLLSDGCRGFREPKYSERRQLAVDDGGDMDWTYRHPAGSATQNKNVKKCKKYEVSASVIYETMSQKTTRCFLQKKR